MFPASELEMDAEELKEMCIESQRMIGELREQVEQS